MSMTRQGKDKILFWLTCVLAVTVMVMIFCFSSQDAEHSGHTSNLIVDLLIRIIKPGFDALEQSRQDVFRERVSFFTRKAAHFTEFAFLGVALLLHVLQWLKIRQIRFPAGLSFLIGVLYACTDEIHQIFVPGRACSIRDIGIDSAGILTGILLLTLLRGRKQ